MAISYGWIDGKMKRLNDDEFMQRFTPRRKGSVWSMVNRKRAENLIEEGTMTPAGFKTVEEAKENGRWDNAYSSRGAVDIPADLIDALKENESAYENYNAFPPSARFMYVHWINVKEEVLEKMPRDCKPICSTFPDWARRIGE